MSVQHTKISQKLQTALLKQYGVVVLIEKEQFYSTRQNRVITMYCVSQQAFDEEKQKMAKKQLIKTADAVEMMKFMVEFYNEVKNSHNKEATQENNLLT